MQRTQSRTGSYCKYFTIKCFKCIWHAKRPIPTFPICGFSLTPGSSLLEVYWRKLKAVVNDLVSGVF